MLAALNNSKCMTYTTCRKSDRLVKRLYYDSNKLHEWVRCRCHSEAGAVVFSLFQSFSPFGSSVSSSKPWMIFVLSGSSKLAVRNEQQFEMSQFHSCGFLRLRSIGFNTLSQCYRRHANPLQQKWQESKNFCKAVLGSPTLRITPSRARKGC